MKTNYLGMPNRHSQTDMTTAFGGGFLWLIKDILSYLTVLQLPPVEAAIGAAELYRSLRKKGLTIRKSNGWMIAYYAIEFSIKLVHSDSDFDLIGKHSRLKTWKSKW
jgi:predicted nucleic acid-binding protein